MTKRLPKIALALAVTWAILACEQQQQAYESGKTKAIWVEAETNLPAIASTQVGYKALNLRFAKTFQEMGFSLIGQTPYYSYFMGEDVIKGGYGPDTLPENLTSPIPNEHQFTIYAVANLDSDPDLDIWKADQNQRIVHIKSDLQPTPK